MSWHYLQEQEAEFLEENSSAGGVLEPSKSKSIQEMYCCKDSLTDAYLDSLFGTTSKHLDQTIQNVNPILKDYKESEINLSYPEDSLVKTCQLQEMEKDSTEKKVNYGLKWPAQSVRYDQDSFSWKIHPSLFQEGLIESSISLPRWGMMQHGELSKLDMPAHLTKEKECGYWQTPTVQDGNGRTYHNQKNGSKTLSLLGQVKYGGKKMLEKYPTPTSSMITMGDFKQAMFNSSNRPEYKTITGGSLNPDWIEWLMGWPLGWTGQKEINFDQWLDAMHGKDPNFDYVPRTKKNVKNRTARIKAIGNGQVPAVVRLAWETLSRVFERTNDGKKAFRNI